MIHLTVFKLRKLGILVTMSSSNYWIHHCELRTRHPST